MNNTNNINPNNEGQLNVNAPKTSAGNFPSDTGFEYSLKKVITDEVTESYTFKTLNEDASANTALKMQVAPDSNEGKLIAIIKKYSIQVYNDASTFKSLIKEHFHEEEIGQLLIKIIDDGAGECYKLRGLTGSEFTTQYNQMVDLIAQKTFIPKGVVLPATKLLCFGLGLNITAPKSDKTSALPSSPLSDFVIKSRVITQYKKEALGGDVVIPHGVISIAKNAFANCQNITSITIPESVITIGIGAFDNCNNITSITIPNSVTSIGVFENCTSLKSLKIPDSVDTIENSAFKNCTSLTEVILPDSITSIGSAAFYKCESLISITIPNGVSGIKQETFEGCTNLVSIKIPRSVNSIGVSAFKECSNLTSIDIPNGVDTIEGGTFKGCVNLETVIFPESLKAIWAGYGNSGAFDDCSNLQTMNIPDSIINISRGTFFDCKKLPEETRNQILLVDSEAFDDKNATVSTTDYNDNDNNKGLNDSTEANQPFAYPNVGTNDSLIYPNINPNNTFS